MTMPSLRKKELDRLKRMISKYHRMDLSHAEIAHKIGRNSNFVADYTDPKDIEFKIQYRANKISDEMEAYFAHYNKTGLKTESCQIAGITYSKARTYAPVFEKGGRAAILAKIKKTFENQSQNAKMQKHRDKLVPDWLKPDFKYSELWNRYLTNSWSNLSVQ